MALMTVFTVSLFAQNSRGRNYIKQNIGSNNIVVFLTICISYANNCFTL
jgi:hypothetical protein